MARGGATAAAAAASARVHAAGMYIIADVASNEGRALAAEAFRYLSEIGAAKDSRLTLVLNPAAGAPPSLLEVSIALLLKQAGAAPSSVGGGRSKAATLLARLLNDVALAQRLR